MEVACSAYYDGNNLDLKSCFSVVSHYGFFEWFIYVVNVGYGVQCVTYCMWSTYTL